MTDPLFIIDLPEPTSERMTGYNERLNLLVEAIKVHPLITVVKIVITSEKVCVILAPPNGSPEYTYTICGKGPMSVDADYYGILNMATEIIRPSATKTFNNYTGE